MANSASGPTGANVVGAIARRELRIAWRKRLVRWLFLLSGVPLLVFATILVVRVVAQETFQQGLDWDPVLRFLQVQIFPVSLLAIGLGTPLVARDRQEDVLFLYATRPVMPVHYTLGKLAAVAVPVAGLLLLPGAVIALLRLGILREVGFAESVMLLAKVAGAAALLGWGLGGVALGASAATARPRWALVLALLLLMVPDGIGGAVFGHDAVALGPIRATEDLLETLFDDNARWRGIVGAAVLGLYGGVGAFVTGARVRREMIP